ncbi:hypothetical protein NPIL_562451 [Nephila pilipes]|uniref:Uncharacterized protein n=1 Tax=Nephila pilipes TaxID=299642 RepID=A0A8X6NHY8_NEPPI|nr:hypothetical protein NPIL_562451 [Nephila pilipes]
MIHGSERGELITDHRTLLKFIGVAELSHGEVGHIMIEHRYTSLTQTPLHRYGITPRSSRIMTIFLGDSQQIQTLWMTMPTRAER